MEQSITARSDFKYLEPSEVRPIINAIPKVSKHPERDILVIEVMWQSGARVSEAVQLTPEHIGVSSLLLPNLKQIKREKQEDGKMKFVHDDKADKEVEVSEVLCRHLKDFCYRNKITRAEYVFQGIRDPKRPLSRIVVYKFMRKASELAGVFKAGKNHPRSGRQYRGASPHQLRHGNAALLLEETKDLSIVQQQLGHSSIVTTQKYAHIKRPRLKKAIKEIDFYSDGTEPEPKKKRKKKKK